MKNFIYLLVGILFTTYVESQNTNKQTTDAIQSYRDYFDLPTESLYLHFNKSSFLRGENLWFQGYAYDRNTNKLNPETRNVEVGIYKSDGTMLEKKLYLALDGLFRGQINVDSTFADGEYYIKAETHYMKNFKEDYSHVQMFEVIGKEQLSEKQTLKDFDLQILPEGGFSIVNCIGNLGIKLLNSKGLGVKFRAKLIEGNSVLSDFESNQFGHAKVSFTPKVGAQYFVDVSLANGKNIRQEVKNIKPYGFNLNVNTLLPKRTVVQISSHLQDDFDYKNANVKLMVHQEGKHFEVPLYFSEDLNVLSKVIKDSQLYYGMNTFTLLVNNRPIAERLVFNNNKSLNEESNVKITPIPTASADSLKLRFGIPDFDKNAQISISVLPDETISYVKNQNITSALLLEPFVSGHVENKPYYFQSSSRRVLYDLDLLLLTQGWSQYSWDNIFNSPPELRYERKKGLTQNISVNGKLKKNIEELIIFTSIYDEGASLKLDRDSTNQFTLENRYPLIGEKIEFAYLDDEKNFKKSNVSLKTLMSFKNYDLSENQLTPSLSNLRTLKLELNKDKLYKNFLKGIELDEVVVKAETKKEGPLRKDYITSFKDNTLEITEDIAATYNFLTDYLVTKGFVVVENAFASDRNERFKIRNMYRTSVNADQSPVVFLDGVRLTDLIVLSGARMSDFEEVVIDRSGYNMGVQGTNGVIRLERRRTPIFTESTSNEDYVRSRYQEQIIEKGFEAPKLFYMPKYANYRSETFQKVGTIAWFSDVKLIAGKPVDLLIFNTGLDKFTLYIEGIAEDGSLINIEKTFEQ